MGRIICIANHKGGVGKTTTTINLGAALALAEKKTLLVDLDPQGHMTAGIGYDKKNTKNNHYEFQESPGIAGLIKKSCITHLDIIPALLGNTNKKIIRNLDKGIFFKEGLKDLKKSYDYIFMDCPPSVDYLSMNAMNASDSIIIPLQCEYFAVESLGPMFRCIGEIRKHYNRHLSIEGILITMFEKDNSVSRLIAGEIKNNFENILFKTLIPRSSHLSGSACFRKPVLLHNINSDAAKSYLSLAGEIVRRERY